jgi:hypothetical protein
MVVFYGSEIPDQSVDVAGYSASNFAGSAQIHRELKTDLSLGAHQVSGDEGRLEHSFGIAAIAYLFLLRAYHQEILPGNAWSVA